ncbi:uncharacterized protein B0T23DRAFT_404370 [Neurospora hispaniola]|uniref:Uncharacterized protein n=1 Tax=Neurospora hispaniola TaxID=588809 RepID=A0AAJ0I7I5_9PEZI|nr:hypothetical protein B0T23DRAFT_404370 [Neurospora hispaniola]
MKAQNQGFGSSFRGVGVVWFILFISVSLFRATWRWCSKGSVTIETRSTPRSSIINTRRIPSRRSTALRIDYELARASFCGTFINQLWIPWR